MKKLINNPTKVLMYIVYISAVILFITFVFPHLIKYFLPFIVAGFISMIINPAVNFMTNKMHINRRISTIVSIIAVLGIIGFLLYFLILQVVGYAHEFILRIPGMLSEEHESPKWLIALNDYIVKFPEPIKGSIQKFSTNFSSNLSGILTPATSATLAFAGSTASKIPSAFIFTVITILATYFMTYDRYRMYEFVKGITGEERIQKIYVIKTRLVGACKAYIKAQLIMMCIMFVVLTVGYIILGVENFLLMAIITAAVDAIPILGTGTIALPWAVISLLTGEYSMALGLIVLYVIALLTRQFFEPKIVSSQIGLHPLVTLMSMYAGFVITGIFGMILGPIVAIVVIKAIEINKEQSEEVSKE